MKTRTALCRATRVSRAFGRSAARAHALHDASLRLDRGELVLLVGPSGSGKSTLLSILAGLLRPDDGDVELLGVSIAKAADHLVTQVRRQNVGFVFQSCQLFDALSVRDNLAEVLALRGMPLAQARIEAASALDRVGVGDKLYARPAELSGGQRQRVAIARALAGSPAVIFGDEPTAALDGPRALDVMRSLRDHADAGNGVLVVTHDARLYPFADRIVAIEDGRVVDESGHVSVRSASGGSR